MNENLENLKQKASQLFHDKRWDELLPVCTKIIELEQEPHEKARAYVQHGIACLQKRELDQAIADFTKALELKDDYAEAYCKRGIAYGVKGDLDQAIADFTKALNLEFNNVSAYLNRGIAYIEKNNHDQAIADFTKALELEPNNMFAYRNRGRAYIYKYDHNQAIADFNKVLEQDTTIFEQDPANAEIYLWRGFAYRLKGDHDKAVTDYTKALKFKLNYAKAHLFYALAHRGRGLAYIKTGNFLDAFKDFVEANFAEANKDDQVPKSKVPEIYFADKIADIYKERSEEEGAKVIELYFRLLEAISNIQQKQFYAPQENAEVAHYTHLHTLKRLADKGRFRLYNAAYMNDPEEGRVFFKIMGETGKGIKKFFYEDEELPYPSPAYIGSFVKVDAKDPKQKDELFLWRTYGKHDGQEAAGACLIFKHEGTVFAEKCGGVMQQLQSQKQSRLLISTDAPNNRGRKQPPKPDLYKIFYSDKENDQELSKKLSELSKLLEQIKEFIEQEKGNGSKRKLKQLVRDLLDSIRFLFKSHNYREEGEVRVVQVRYYDEENTPQDDGSIQVDMEQIPPRFYLETHENFRFSEVILGRQARGFLEWKRWLNEHDNTLSVKRSGIKYRKPYL